MPLPDGPDNFLSLLDFLIDHPEAWDVELDEKGNVVVVVPGDDGAWVLTPDE